MTVTLRITTTGVAAGLTTLATIMALTAKIEWSAPDAPEPPAFDAQPAPIVEPPPPIPRRQETEQRVEDPQLTARLDQEVAPQGPPQEATVLGDAFPALPPVITEPRWTERPNAADFTRHYPRRALERGREGRVVLDCVVAANRRIGCSVAEETPAGWGFGDAALRISEAFRMSPMLENGQPTEGGRVRVPISFRLN